MPKSRNRKKHKKKVKSWKQKITSQQNAFYKKFKTEMEKEVAIEKERLEAEQAKKESEDIESVESKIVPYNPSLTQ